MNLTIDNRDLTYTIDTYGMFSGGELESSEREYYQEEYKLTDEEAEALEFNYDHKAIVRDFATASVELLEREFVNNGDGIVKSITLEASNSPQFYNYTTDSYRAIWSIDHAKLKAFVLADFEAFRAFVFENWSTVDSNTNWHDKTHLSYNYATETHSTSDVFDDHDTIVAMLDFYTRSEYSEDSYNMSMWEVENNAYIENMSLDDASKALIDSKEVK